VKRYKRRGAITIEQRFMPVPLATLESRRSKLLDRAILGTLGSPTLQKLRNADGRDEAKNERIDPPLICKG
jgi:hypothetical protein